MRNEFTAIIEQDGEWYIAYCPEIPGANGQGRTKDEARESLAHAIALIFEVRREDALRGLPPDAERLRHLRKNGCYLKREGRAHSLWCNPTNGVVEAVPRHSEIPDRLALKICRAFHVPEIGK